MDPMTWIALANLASSVIQGVAQGTQAQEQATKLSDYQQQLANASRQTYQGQSSQLYQQMLQQQQQYSTAMQQRRQEGLMNLSMIAASATSGNISGNSIMRQLAVARGSETQAAGQAEVNLQQTQANYMSRALQLRRDLESTLNKINSQRTPDPFLTGLTAFGQSGGFSQAGSLLGSIL